MKKTSKMKMPSKSKMDEAGARSAMRGKAKLDEADNGKGFKKVPKGKEKGTAEWTPPWAKKNDPMMKKGKK